MSLISVLVNILARTDREYVKPALDLWISQVVPLKIEYSDEDTVNHPFANLYYANEEKS